MRRTLQTFGVVLALAVPGLAQDADMSKVEIETVPISHGIAMLVGQGGNIGVSFGPDGSFLVDDQFAPLTEKIEAAVKKLHDGPIRFVLNTHWHFDHTGGNENFGRGGALIVAHENVRERMSVDQTIPAVGRTIPASPEVALPVVTFDSSVTFHWNGEEIHAFHVEAAHTDGDAILHFRKSDVLHMGDVFFNGMYPFLDTSSGGSVDGMIAAAGRGLEIADDDTKIIPGHGPLATRADLERARSMLVTVRDRVRKALDSGSSADEIVASKPTADLDETWGGGFLKPDDFVRIVATSLSAK